MNTFFKQANLKQAHRLGLLFVIWFVLCFAWFYIQPAERDLHLRLFRLSFLYFTDMGFMSIISGAIQTYLWGYIGICTWAVASMLAGFKK